MSYLFSFKGRINRARIWLFLVICICVDIVLGVIAAYGFDWSVTLKSFVAVFKDMTPGQELDLHKIAAPAMTGTSYPAIAAMAVIYLLVVWAGFAIFVKRLHDRGKSAWWLLLYWLLPLALQAFMFATAPSILDAIMGVRTPLGHAAYGVATLISLWVFIELYFFRGTRGDNRFGPDPLA